MSGFSVLRFAQRQTNGMKMQWRGSCQHCMEKEALVCWLDIPAETKKIFKDVKRLLVEKLRPSGFVAFAEFQARKLRPGENSTAVCA